MSVPERRPLSAIPPSPPACDRLRRDPARRPRRRADRLRAGDSQCDGDCARAAGLGLLVGAVVGAGGMAIVAVLVLRAMGEWREIQDRERPAMRPVDGPTDAPSTSRELAATLARRRRDARGGAPTSTTGSDHDQVDRHRLVTEFDRAAEALIVERLRRARPDDAIVGEEGAADSGTTGYAWFIDPIDGTTNFVYGLPTWASSVGRRRATATMLAGAVYVPPLDELFDRRAAAQGATLNGDPIAVSDETDLGLALVGTGFSYHARRAPRQAARLARMIGRGPRRPPHRVGGARPVLRRRRPRSTSTSSRTSTSGTRPPAS